MFENYSKVVVLLVKALQQELTVEEEEKVRAWREACGVIREGDVF